MAKKTNVAKLTDESVLRVARARITEPGLNEYGETSLDTQLSVERGVIWMINFIEFNFNSLEGLADMAAGAVADTRAQVTRESKTAIVNGNDSDLVQMAHLHTARSAAIGTDAGPLWIQFDAIIRYDFPIGLPYASQTIFCGLRAALPAVQICDVRIGYTIKEVDDQFFFRVAQALLG